MNVRNTLLKRARSKYFTNGLIYNLLKLDSPLKQSYWRTYRCAETIIESNGEYTSEYCKNRWCITCNKIRTAINIKKYSSEISSWGIDKYMVTLTIPNIDSTILNETIDDMLHTFTNCSRSIKKKYPFLALRKLECTYNPDTNTYHPHFHCVVKGKQVADLLKLEWIKRYPSAELFCQDVRQCNDNSVMELFKYFSKVISTQKYKNSDNAPVEYKRKIYINALDIIFQAVHGRRTFQNYGFNAKNVDENEGETLISCEIKDISGEINHYRWEKGVNDWLNIGTGEVLTGYKPSEALIKLLDDIELME